MGELRVVLLRCVSTVVDDGAIMLTVFRDDFDRREKSELRLLL